MNVGNTFEIMNRLDKVYVSLAQALSLDMTLEVRMKLVELQGKTCALTAKLQKEVDLAIDKKF